MRALLAILGLALLSACTPTLDTATRSAEGKAFDAVAQRVIPVAARYCREVSPDRPCDYRLILDRRLGAEPNAFQTVERNGRPVVGITPSMIDLTRNVDELAFIVAHEAAHHIAGHIERGRMSAAVGAQVIGDLVAARGGSAADIREAQGFGAFLGARRFAQEFELEADALGARIALEAGFNPLRGVQFFQNAPDPGAQFLGTHPPNAARIEIVRRAVAGS